MPAITSEISTPAPTRSLRPIRSAVATAATAATSMFTSAIAAAAATAATASSLSKTTITTARETPSSNSYSQNSISTQQPDTLERRLQPDVDTVTGSGSRVGVNVDRTTALPNRLANILLSNFLPATNTSSPSSTRSSSSGGGSRTSVTYPIFRPPSIENLVANSAEDLNDFRDVSFDIFDDNDDLFGSPLAFDASENGLWNGRFVPPPPRPPFFVDEPVLSDGLTTCDLCSWAMPTKSTFIFEGTIEKASELGWPLTLIIVSVLSALLGAIVMVTVVRCRRKKPTNNRNGKCTKLAEDNPSSYHEHHQQLQYNQHLNHHYPHQHQYQHHHNLNQYVHEHHHLYPNAYRDLHAQYPLPSHHTVTPTQQQKRPPQSLPLQYVSNSCSSSSLTNDSQSTQRTSLSTIYRPPSYYSSATVLGGSIAIMKATQKQKLLTQRIDMFTRSLPPPPSPPRAIGAAAVGSRISIASSCSSSRSRSSSSRRGDVESICSDSYAPSSVAYEEPTAVDMAATTDEEFSASTVEAAVMVAERTKKT
ncbi:lateral signaling target protein 2 homolog isoform X1 [Anastrepha ludens]|uniref:lateral signaling target protein 2 homolog isoform X1 n=1 Tax=Anastrepha ludens TaxID=28586 RepID=UPI0023B17F8E|nr:lateral signaling target protein 2 homolog isoform X1 [Anastrepha ludens]